MKTGVDNTEGAAADFEQIESIGLTYKDLGDDVDNFLKECLQETKNLVDKNWYHIEDVSKALLGKKVLSGKEVLEIMKAIYH